jgi:hypothetical protein
MGIGILSGSRDCCSETYEQKNVINSNPDPGEFEIVQIHGYNGNVAIEINYPSCTNYEGNKIIVYKDTNMTQLLQLKKIDPHFIEENKIKPFARFEPTEAGWFYACELLSII